MNSQRCFTCKFYAPLGELTGACTILGGLFNRPDIFDEIVLFVCDTYTLEKIKTPKEKIYTPVLVKKTFGCVHHKKKD